MLDLSLPEAIEALAKIARDSRAHPPTQTEKQAAGLSDLLTSVGNTLRNNPTLAGGVLGGLGGAAIGGGSTAFGNRDREEGERRSVLGSALTGGLAGAAVGGGGAAAHQYLTGGSGHGGAARPGEFTDPDTGTRMRVDPSATQAHQRLRELTQGPSPHERGVQAIAGNIWNVGTSAVPGLNPLLSRMGMTYGDGDTFVDQHLPVSASILPKVGLLDTLMHLPGLNLGQRIGLGRIDPRYSNDPRDLRAGMAEHGEKMEVPAAIRSAVTRNQGGVSESIARNLQGDANPGGSRVRRMLDRLLGRTGDSTESVLNLQSHPQSNVTETTPLTGGGTRRYEFEQPSQAGPRHDSLSRSTAQDLAERGYSHRELNVEKQTTPRGLQRLGSLQYQTLPRAAAIASRLGLYGLIPGLEYGYNSWSADRNRQHELQSLLARYARPTQGS